MGNILIQAPCPDCGRHGCRTGYSFSVRQSGLQVASGSASKADDAIRECNRYAFAYAADGPVQYAVRHGRKVIGSGSLRTSRAAVASPPKAEDDHG